MHSESPPDPDSQTARRASGTPQRDGSTKPPRALWDGIYAFPSNRETLGGTAYLVCEPQGNISIDCPPWDETTAQFLRACGGICWLFLTHRGGIAQAGEMQAALGCEVVAHEREAYLLPDATVTSFGADCELTAGCQAIWTPGYSPGSSCLYCRRHGGILFSGRHLLPNQQGEPVPLRMGKTFHWFRQLRSVQALRDRFSAQTLHYICPGAGTGFLRGQGAIADAYAHLAALDLDSLRQEPPVLQ